MENEENENEEVVEDFESILTEDLWTLFLQAFEENGVNAYHTLFNPEIPQINSEQIRERAIRLGFNDTHDQVRADFYHYRDIGENDEERNLIAELRTKFINLFIQCLMLLYSL